MGELGAVLSGLWCAQDGEHGEVACGPGAEQQHILRGLCTIWRGGRPCSAASCSPPRPAQGLRGSLVVCLSGMTLLFTLESNDDGASSALRKSLWV